MRNYEKRARFICVLQRDELGLVVTEWQKRPEEHASNFIEQDVDRQFCDCPEEHGEYVVHGVYVETFEARDHWYPGSFEQTVVDTDYTFLCDQPELEVA